MFRLSSLRRRPCSCKLFQCEINAESRNCSERPATDPPGAITCRSRPKVLARQHGILNGSAQAPNSRPCPARLMWYLPSDRGIISGPAGADCVKLCNSRRTREHRSWHVAAPGSCAKASFNCRLTSCLALVVRDDVMEHEGCDQGNLKRLEAEGSVEYSAERTERAAWSDGRLLDGRAVSCEIQDNRQAVSRLCDSRRLRSSFKLCSSSTCVTASTDSASNKSVHALRCSSQRLCCRRSRLPTPMPDGRTTHSPVHP